MYVQTILVLVLEAAKTNCKLPGLKLNKKVLKSETKVSSAFLLRQGATVHELGSKAAGQPGALWTAGGLRLHQN